MQRKIKILGAMTIAILALVFVHQKPLYALSDIEGHWAKDYIEDLVAEGAVSGYPDGSFKPNKSVSVGEFFKIVTINFGGDNDVVQGAAVDWALPYYQKAIAIGFAEQGDKDLQNLKAQITRAQIARVLGRVTDAKQTELGGDIYAESHKVTDFSSLKEVDRRGVLIMLRLGVIEGYKDGSFKGDSKATRAELAAMLYRFKHPKLAAANPAYDSIIIREGDGKDTSYFSIILDYSKEIAPQYKALETYLEDKMSIDELEDILKYIKSKKGKDDALPPRNFAWKRGNISVQAVRGTGFLTIIAD